MIKNDILLKVILFLGFFLFARPFITALGFFLPTAGAYWFGVIGAGVFSFLLQSVVFERIDHSVSRAGELRTTMRWGLYIFTGIVLFVIIKIKFVDEYIYGWRYDGAILNRSGFFDYLIYYTITIAALVITYKLTRLFVSKIAELKGSNQNNFVPQVIPQQIQPIKSPDSLDVTIRNKNDKATIHGSSEFLDNQTFNSRYNNKSNDEMRNEFESHGGYVIVPNAVKYIKHTHKITIAGAGQGKGTTAIIPNLLTKPQESWIVLDVKGENAAVTARFQKNSGQQVYIIDPFGVQTFIEAEHHINSTGFNPLIVAKYLPKEEIIDFAAMVAEMFIPDSSKSSSSDNFFIDSARNNLKTYITHIITDKNITERHLGLLYEWLRLDQDKEIDLWVDMSANPYTTHGTNEIKSVAIKSAETWMGILSEMRRATAFLESPLIRKSLESEGFDPMILQNSNATVYVILPERNLNTHKAWLRLVFGTTLKLCNFIAKKRVNFLMDEFPILGKMDDFLRAFAFGRGQKISCWIVAQSLSQLKEIYGEDGLNTFLSNAKLRQFFGVNDYYTQKYVSDLLGMTTEITTAINRGKNEGQNKGVSRSMGSFFDGSNSVGTTTGVSMGDAEQLIQRPLQTPEEVGNLKDEFILLVDGEKYKFPKVPYYRDHVFPDRFDRNPYVGQ